MPVHCISDMLTFEAIKPDWERVYSADPQAHIFVSWGWLRGFFEITRYRWLVLAFQPDPTSPFTAFLPLTLELRSYYQERTLRIGGMPTADYTGFLCLPGAEIASLAAFKEYLVKELSWDVFNLADILDPRLERFLLSFDGGQHIVQELEQTACPVLTLPGSWDDYLENQVGQSNRRKIKYCLRKIEGLEGYRATYLDAESFDLHVDTLIGLWEVQWKVKANVYRTLFRRCFENDQLWMVILWDGNTPIAAASGLIDWPKKTFYGFIMSMNPDYLQFSPGKVVVAHSIRFAVQQGIRFFDFLRGGEAYKFAFGAEERFATSFVIRHKSMKRIVEQQVGRLVRRASNLWSK